MGNDRKINMTFNCPLKREELQIKDGKYFCQHCAKQIFDFTDKSTDEIRKASLQAEQPICGIVKKSQVRNPIKGLNSYSLKYAAASMLISSSLVVTAQEQ